MTPHPDEGTLHAFIDGELPRSEAAALELHVAGCALCAAALAEARGFVAGASRAITALDAAPSSGRAARPVASAPTVAAAPRAARPRFFRAPFARAAALLLLAGGTAVVVGRSGTGGEGSATSVESIVADATTKEERFAPGAAAASAAAAVVPPAARTTVARSKSVPLPAAAATGAYSERRVTSEADFTGSGVASGRASVPTTQELAVAAPPSPPAAAVRERAPMPFSRALGLERAVATGAMVEVSPAPRITRYRLENGVILTLTDEPLRASFAAEGESQRKVSQMNPAAAVPAVNVYRWHSSELERSYTLTGPLPVTDLEAAARRLADLERVP